MARSEPLGSLASRIERAELEVRAADMQVAGTTTALKAQWKAQVKAQIPGIAVTAVGAVVLRQLLRSKTPAIRDPRMRWALRAAAPLISFGRARAMTAISALAAGYFAAKKLRPLATASNVDLARLGGLWYEIARLPTRREAEGDLDITAHYQVYADGIRITNRSRRADGTSRKATARARVADASGNSKLRISFAPALLDGVPTVWSDLWILDRADDYSTAIVGTPDRKSLWILARTPEVAGSVFDSLVSTAAALEFDTAGLIRSRHTGPSPAASPYEQVTEPAPLSAAA